jgi:predicted nuclease of predicted toxin-antitoxin system
MQWIADENIPNLLIQAMRGASEDVVRVVELARSAPDEVVLQLALTGDRLLLTEDTDFGDLVLRRHLPVSGVVLLRLEHLPINERIRIVLAAIRTHGERLYGSFTVIEAGRVRIRSLRETNSQP